MPCDNETTLTEVEKAMQWERMSGERLSDADRQKVQNGETFVPPHLRPETTPFNPEQLERAFLRLVQEGNGCNRRQEQGGSPCREKERCGCWLEMRTHYEDAA